MLPVVSIIIPTYNRPAPLEQCLKALSQLDYPRDRFEVVVVDDGSTISPAGIVEGFCSRLDIRMLRQANAGPAAARNLGAQEAKGQILAFTDDDCLPDPAWLGRMA